MGLRAPAAGRTIAILASPDLVEEERGQQRGPNPSDQDGDSYRDGTFREGPHQHSRDDERQSGESAKQC